MVRGKNETARGAGLSLAEFREYNRENLLDWLGAYAAGDRVPTGRRPLRVERRARGRQRPAPHIPLSDEELDDLEDPDVQATNKIMRRVVDALREEQRAWYVLLSPVFFSEEASPARAEQWRKLALEDESENFRALYDVYLRVVDWMLDRAEELLEEEGRKRLVSPNPYLEGVHPPRMAIKAKQRRARDAYFGYLEELGYKVEAARRAAQETGYKTATILDLARK